MRKLFKDWQLTLISVIVFAAVFVFVGQGLPKLFIEHFDNTDYISFDLPMSIEPTIYKAGERVNILSNSHVKANLETTIDLQLMRVNAGDVSAKIEPDLVDNVTIVRSTSVDGIIFSKTDEKGRMFTTQLPLSKDTPKGNYYIQGIIHYQIKGVDKSYYFYTQQFSVE